MKGTPSFGPRRIDLEAYTYGSAPSSADEVQVVARRREGLTATRGSWRRIQLSNFVRDV